LTFYDATYLELARRLALPLATLDDALINAAPQWDVLLIR
jgi:predicted nucleic acid-binding protein